jgi:hypothetical protein
MSRRLLGAPLVTAVIAVGGLAAGVLPVGVLPAVAAAQPPPPAGQLQGAFQMSGTVTVAQNVSGEHVGDLVTRTWTFTPQCATAPCPTVLLVRQRATGSDTLILRETPSGTYAGTGSFSAPLRCSGRVYPQGEMIPFKITVRVTASTGTTASAISARYVNPSRTNRTPCIGLLGHDAARYTGQLAAG